MSLPNDVRMEDILLEDDERDSIEYKILMAYARRRLPASKYWKLLKNEANVQKPLSLAGRGVTSDHHQLDEDGPVLEFHNQGYGTRPRQTEPNCFPGYHLPPLPSKGKVKKQGSYTAAPCPSDFIFQGNFQDQSSEPADVGHIADKLAELVTVTPRSWQCPLLVVVPQGPRLQEDKDEVLIQSIVSLLKEKGDQLEEEMKRDGAFYQCFQDTLSYNFFKRITDRFLRDVSANSPGVTGGQAQRLKIAYTMEVATRLNAVDNHPMNLVLGFGSKYLREHFKPWIQNQGGWEKAVISLDEEEVE
ncbi:apoptosis facilitator Bcl-2-like protein 14 [Melanerpes formicivorus]|uniref:apoptosis facilitator Bcl-2-like protein 14 n=1 Tax=Melanerpes formicivorus TaxID=211600 RepID=UPI00358FAD3E